MSEKLILINEKSTIFLKIGDNYIFSKVNIKELPSNFYPNNLNIYIILITAFFAGFILNFMPCVLPVLGIKINNLLKQSETRNKSIVKISSLYVSLGIISMFFIFFFSSNFFKINRYESWLGNAISKSLFFNIFNLFIVIIYSYYL